MIRRAENIMFSALFYYYKMFNSVYLYHAMIQNRIQSIFKAHFLY